MSRGATAAMGDGAARKPATSMYRAGLGLGVAAEMTMHTAEKLKVHRILSLLTLALGLVLMTYMVIYESEPGAIPLLLIVVGTGWYFMTRKRGRSVAE